MMNVASDMVVLVVEDHDFQRRTMVRMLHSLGAREVLEAPDGSRALELLGAGSPSVGLVVCDLNMPEMDGLEFIRRLGESQHAASVIIQSAQDRALLHSVEKMTHAYGVRLLGVLAKPISLPALAELIARHRMRKPVPAARPASSYALEAILQGVRERQFEPFFQPKVEVPTGRVVGAEALARWRHPQDGVVGPFAFIPVLEENRCLESLTFLMLEEAALACRSWRSAGFDLTVAVNLSLVSLADLDLAERITRAIAATRLESRHMMLEITETAAMTEVAPALENLARLRMRGFGLSIDDYGTGFASLRQLTRVPFSELKIDQSFVTGCAANPSARTIVQSSVEMAERLGIKTVAEGVETEADWNVVADVRCNLAQGYFIAKPMDAQSFLDFCRKQAS